MLRLRRRNQEKGLKEELKQAVALHRQKRYTEAEQLLRHLVQQREVLGAEHVNTLESKYWLAVTLHSQNQYVEAEQLLRQSAQQRERVLGAADIKTLESKHLLAITLYHQKKYTEAEQLLRQLVQQHKEVLGTEDARTLWSNYWLAVTLYFLNQYAEAEQLLRQLIRLRGKVLGAEDIETLESKYQLAVTLSCQEKYTEAEQLLRQSVQQRERVLGAEDARTLWSNYWLAVTLYFQNQYAEAEQLLRQSVQQRERVLGAEDIETLESKYQLAVALASQKKYTEAEQLLRQSVQQRERVLGAEDKKTLDSKSWLAITLHSQKKCTEAEQLLRQTVQQWEMTLGADHKHTLSSKYQLAVTLYRQKRYTEAEQLSRQLIQQQVRTLGADDQQTLASEVLLREAVLATARSAQTNVYDQLAVGRLNEFFANNDQRQTAYNESDIEQVSLLLHQVNPQWSKVTRIYIVLRTIDCLDLLNTFVNEGCSDHWLPFAIQGLPSYLRPGKRSQFLAAQNLVMTKSMDLEKGQHCYFQKHETAPLDMKGSLGHGAYGLVDRVMSTISFRQYALKRLRRSERTKEDIKRFIAEIEILKRLKHQHVVEFVGSYTDQRYIGLLMSPVADMDLCTYLALANGSQHRELRTFFGCLARALDFLHGENVRHKDIKPKNILVHGDNVLFSDFGIAFDFTDQDGSTTVGIGSLGTPKYLAPEVATDQPRNTSSDIWSLGVVFLEMIMVLKGRTVQYMYDFLKEHGSQQAFVYTNITGTQELITELKELGSPTDNAALGWVENMVMLKQQLRPTAASLIASIVTQKGGGNDAFCGICCVVPDNVVSEFDTLELS
jgi:TolA-binding protein